MPFKEIIGQKRLKTILYNSMLHDMLSHAYLFLGPENTGKKHAAMVFAKSLLCLDFKEDPCNLCPSCKKIQNLTHPDLLIIEPEKNSIKIEAMRHVKRYVGLKPFEAKRKIVIIDRMDKATKEASNSFLKILEEPPLDTIFVLTSPAYHSLLPTIVSRCQKIMFHLLPPSLITDFLREKHSLDKKKAEQLSLLSRGRIGRALFLKDNLDLKNRERAFEIISDLSLDRLDVILKSAKSLAKEKEDMDELFEWLFLLCRDIAVLDQTADTSHVINRDRVEDLKGLAGTIPVKAVYKIYDTVKNTQLLLKRNVNTQLALENMMIDVSSLKAGVSERQI